MKRLVIVVAAAGALALSACGADAWNDPDAWNAPRDGQCPPGKTLVVATDVQSADGMHAGDVDWCAPASAGYGRPAKK